MSIRSVARPLRVDHGTSLWGVAALALLWLGCSSSGGAGPTPIACSVTRPCPDGFVCALDRGLCALPSGGDLAVASPDMTLPSGDMAMLPADMAMLPADMAMLPADMAMLPVDMAMPPMDMAMPPMDMAMPPVDMAMPPVDMAMPPADMAMPPRDMAMPPADMAMPPRDMTMPPADMTVPPDMAMPPPGSEACPAANWCWQNQLPQPRDLLGVWGANASDIWTVGARGVALHFNGTSWLQVATGTTQRLRGIWGRTANLMWVVGDAGTILRWDGTRFTAQTSGTTESLVGLWGDSSVVWAVGEHGTLLKWNGLSWTKVAIGTTSGLYAIWGSASNDIWTVGEGGMVCRFGGVSWTCGREFPATSTALALVGTSKTNVWAFGTMTDAWQWNGIAWSARPKPATPSTVFGATALGTHILAVGLDGAGMVHDGTSWSGLTLGSATLALNGAWATSSTNSYVVGAGGTILNFDGTTVRPHSSGFTGTISAMWGSSERDVWVFTLDGLGHHYDGTRWADTTLPSDGYSATGYGSNNVWVGSDAGRLMNYDGTRWTIVNTRDSGAPIRGIYIASSDRVALVSSSAVQFWDGARFTIELAPTWLPTAVWGTGPNDIWVAGIPGCPYARWNGATWTSGTVPGCTAGIAAIHGTSASNMYMVGDSPGDSVYRWDGSKFTTIATGSSASKTDVFTIGTRTFVTTTSGEVLIGNGGTWTTSLNLGSSLGFIAGFAADKVWVGGASSYVLSYKP